MKRIFLCYRISQNYIIISLLPFSEVDKPGFKYLIVWLIGTLVIRSRPFMVETLKKTYNKTRGNLISELDNAAHVCTTTDCRPHADVAFYEWLFIGSEKTLFVAMRLWVQKEFWDTTYSMFLATPCLTSILNFRLLSK